MWTSGRTSPSHPLREGSERPACIVGAALWGGEMYQLAGRQGKDAEHEMAGDLAMLLQLIRSEGAWRWVPACYANGRIKQPMRLGRGAAPISTDGSGCVAVQRRTSPASVCRVRSHDPWQQTSRNLPDRISEKSRRSEGFARGSLLQSFLYTTVAARYGSGLRVLLGCMPHGSGDDLCGGLRGECPAWVDTPPGPSWRADRSQVSTIEHAKAQGGGRHSHGRHRQSRETPGGVDRDDAGDTQQDGTCQGLRRSTGETVYEYQPLSGHAF